MRNSLFHFEKIQLWRLLSLILKESCYAETWGSQEDQVGGAGRSPEIFEKSKNSEKKQCFCKVLRNLPLQNKGFFSRNLTKIPSKKWIKAREASQVYFKVFDSTSRHIFQCIPDDFSTIGLYKDESKQVWKDFLSILILIASQSERFRDTKIRLSPITIVKE